MFASVVFATALAATQTSAQPEIDRDAPVTLSASVIAADLSGPHAVITLEDQATGRRFLAEGLHSTALARMGFSGDRLVGQRVGFEGFRYAGGAGCTIDCRVRARSLTLPDGTRIFLGESGAASATAPVPATPRALASAVASALARPGVQPAPVPAIDFDAPIRTRGEIVAVDETIPRLVITLRDEAGTRFTFEGITANTLRRLGGVEPANFVGQTIDFEGFYFVGARDCRFECRVRVRSLTFADGTRIFYGAAPPSTATAPASTISR